MTSAKAVAYLAPLTNTIKLTQPFLLPLRFRDSLPLECVRHIWKPPKKSCYALPLFRPLTHSPDVEGEKSATASSAAWRNNFGLLLFLVAVSVPTNVFYLRPLISVVRSFVSLIPLNLSRSSRIHTGRKHGNTGEEGRHGKKNVCAKTRFLP